MVDDADLFDIVPWEYGFVHSGVLAWLLERDGFAGLVLGAATCTPWDGSVRVIAKPKREARVGKGSADLAFTVTSQQCGELRVALETKVQDLLRPRQLSGYRKAGYQPMLYMPGLTGLMSSLSWISDEDCAMLAADKLCAALEPAAAELPPVIASYVSTLRHEANRFAAAVAHARGEATSEPGPGKTPQRILADVAWIVAVQAELQDRCAADPRQTFFAVDSLGARDVAFDRGLYWDDSHTVPSVVGGSVGFYIDIVAVKATSERAVVIKAGFVKHDLDALGPVYDHAQIVGPPPSDRWIRGRRRLGGDSVTCWRAPASDLTAREAANLACEAAAWIDART